MKNDLTLEQINKFNEKPPNTSKNNLILRKHVKFYEETQKFCKKSINSMRTTPNLKKNH